MKNVTVSLDDEVARWARVRAAEKNSSVSRLLGELLREKMRDEHRYRRAMRDFFSKPATRISAGEPYPRREELHDRAGLR